MEDYEKLKKILKDVEIISEQYFIKGKKVYSFKLRKKLKELMVETKVMWKNVNKTKKSMKGFGVK
jgi:Tfp pilus assembly protein PilZ